MIMDLFSIAIVLCYNDHGFVFHSYRIDLLLLCYVCFSKFISTCIVRLGRVASAGLCLIEDKRAFSLFLS